MAKIDDIKKEIEEYKELIADASVPQDEKDFAKGEIADLEKQLEALEKKTEKKPEAKAEKKPEAKTEKKSEKPKRDEDEDEEADCDDLQEREAKASKLGYDIDELLTQAKERKAKAKQRAEKMKGQPKKTPITKAKEKVEKTTKTIVKGLETSAEKGKLTIADLERIIAEYEEALKRFKKMLEKLRAEKMARGGNAKKPKIVRTIFEEEEFEYGEGGGVPMSIRRRLEELRQEIRNESISYGEIAELQSLVRYIDEGDVELLEWAGVDENDLAEYGKPIAICNRTGSYVYPTQVEGYFGYCPELDEDVYEMETTPLMRRGGRTTMTDLKRDKMFRAKESGKRKSKKIAVVEMKGGGSYRRKNSNQYYNDNLGNRSEIGGRTYYEGANNRSDKNKWS